MFLPFFLIQHRGSFILFKGTVELISSDLQFLERHFRLTITDGSFPLLMKNDRFVLKTTKKNQKTKRSFFKTTVYENDRSLTTVNDEPLLTTVHKDRSLTIVNNLL